LSKKKPPEQEYLDEPMDEETALALIPAPLLEASQRAAVVSANMQRRAMDAVRSLDRPDNAAGDALALYRANSVETALLMQGAVVAVLQAGKPSQFSGACGIVEGPLTTNDLVGLERVLTSADQRALIMMGQPTKITAAHSESFASVQYTGQKTVPAVVGDEMTEDDLRPSGAVVEGESVVEGEIHVTTSEI